jgi:hypothetical protein
VSRAASFAADPLDLDTVMSPLLSLKGASRAAATAALLSLRVGTSPQLGSEETSRASDAATFPLDRKTDTTSLLNPRVMSQVVDITVVLSGLATVALLLLSRAANAVVALRHLEPVPSPLPSFKELSQATVPAAVLLDLETFMSPLLSSEDTIRVVDTAATLLKLETIAYILPSPEDMGQVAASAAALSALETFMSLLPSPEEISRATDATAILLDHGTAPPPRPCSK